MISGMISLIGKILMIGILIAQGFLGRDMPLDNPMEDPLARAVTPPASFQYFNQDYSSKDTERMMTWIHPNRGLVKYGVLLTYDEARESFDKAYEDSDDVDVNVAYNYGVWGANKTFQADTWVEYAFMENGSQTILRFHNIFVFEVINNGWYLVQIEFIPSDTGLPYSYESGTYNPDKELPYSLRQFSDPTLFSEVGSWPLLLGTNFTQDNELRPLEAKTAGGRQWSLAQAVSLGKPTVLHFLSTHSVMIGSDEEIDLMVGFQKELYNTFGYENLYVFGVTESGDWDIIDWLVESGNTEFAMLLDEDSTLHADLNITRQPYVVVFDGEGTVIAISETFHSTSHDLLLDIIRGATAKAN
jgi:hypothetical protein